MPLHEERSVRIDGAKVVWDGITRPETMDDGGQKLTLKVIVPPHSPDLPILQQLACQCLNESEFKGNLPQGAYWVMSEVGPNEFGGGFGGWYVVNGITYRAPDVYDENGGTMSAMQYGQLLFPGQEVNILVSCKAYNNKSRGIKAQLEAFQIVTSANAQRLAIGGGPNTAAAFGGTGQPSQAAGQQPGFQQPMGGQQPGFQQPTHGQGFGQQGQTASTSAGAAPGMHPGTMGAAGTAGPGAASPMGGQQPGFQQPAQQPMGGQQPGFQQPGTTTSPSNGGGQPSQAHNFLPGGGQ